jgi:hypothetical protein
MSSRSPEGGHARRETSRSFDAPTERERPAAAEARRRDFLEALGREINALPPLRSRIIRGSRMDPMVLHVVNPDAPHMIEDIGCEPIEGGEFWFTWSWGHTLGPADDPAGVAASIRRVLCPQM